MPAKNAERGAVSIDCVQDRRTRKVIAAGAELGAGINERKTADGRCAKTIVWKVSLSFSQVERGLQYLHIPKSLSKCGGKQH